MKHLGAILAVAAAVILSASVYYKCKTGQTATGAMAPDCEKVIEARFLRVSALREQELEAAKAECDRVYGPASECRDIVNGLSEECGP